MIAAHKLNRMEAFIRAYWQDHGYGPSIREIQEGCAVSSKSTVVYRLDALEGAGRIMRDRDKARTVRVV